MLQRIDFHQVLLRRLLPEPEYQCGKTIPLPYAPQGSNVAGYGLKCCSK
jgi:hypothetical protein